MEELAFGTWLTGASEAFDLILEFLEPSDYPSLLTACEAEWYYLPLEETVNFLLHPFPVEEPNLNFPDFLLLASSPVINSIYSNLELGDIENLVQAFTFPPDLGVPLVADAPVPLDPDLDLEPLPSYHPLWHIFVWSLINLRFTLYRRWVRF